jgi:hypothetical protein
MPSDDQTKGSTSDDRAPSSFRTMMQALRDMKGDTPQWPVILRAFLQAECLRQQPHLTPYTSTVAISRHDESAEGVTVPEKKAVRELYTTCVKNHQSVFRIGDEGYLLLGWEWPNQASESRMAADLVALNRTGGLVVFEAKSSTSKDTPFTAALEGLDYLVHLTLHQNFRQIINAVAKWKAEGLLNPPEHFQEVQPSLSSRHEVIVLAPDGYYNKFTKSQRGHGWEEFRNLASDTSAFVDIRFGKTDFSTNNGSWA